MAWLECYRKGCTRSKCWNGLHSILLNRSSNRWSTLVRCCFASSNENDKTAGTKLEPFWDVDELWWPAWMSADDVCVLRLESVVLVTRGRFGVTLFSDVVSFEPILRPFFAAKEDCELLRVAERVTGMLWKRRTRNSMNYWLHQVHSTEPGRYSNDAVSLLVGHSPPSSSLNRLHTIYSHMSGSKSFPQMNSHILCFTRRLQSTSWFSRNTSARRPFTIMLRMWTIMVCLFALFSYLLSRLSFTGGEVTQRFDANVLNVCTPFYSFWCLPTSTNWSQQGFAARIPDSFLQSLQSLQGDIIDYIGTDASSCPNSMGSNFLHRARWHCHNAIDGGAIVYLPTESRGSQYLYRTVL
jgi:hypothetical protein